MKQTRARLISAAVAALVLTAAVGRAADPAPGDSYAGAAERAAEIATQLKDVAPTLAPCRSLGAHSVRCGNVDVDSCRAALALALSKIPGETPDERRARALVGSALHGLANIEHAERVGTCPHLARPGRHAVELALDDDGRTLHVRAVPPLRAGRRYALEVAGVEADEITALRRSTKPRGGARRSYASLAAETLGSTPSPVDAQAVQQALTRWEADTALLRGIGNDVPLRLQLSRPADAATLERVRFTFVPESEATPDATLTRFRTFEGRAELHAYRKRLADRACEAIPLLAADAELIGAIPALDIEERGDHEGRARLLGAPAAASRPTNLPVRLQLPPSANAETPLIVLLPGHHLTAGEMIAAHGPALVERGLAVIAIDLPEQGARTTNGRSLLEILDPAALTVRLRQAAADVIATSRAARACGFGLAGGEVYRPTTVRFFGFSLGAMVGTLVRSVSPELGTTVLVAPGGGIARWLKLRILTAFGAPLVSCSAGPEEGQSCLATGHCAPPGVCRRDPDTERLWSLIEPSYAWLSAGADPLTFATERTGGASTAPLLIVTGGEDAALHPALASRLADAYRLKRAGDHRRRGPHATMIQWPALGHELLSEDAVRKQVYAFLASDGRESGDD